MHQIARVILTLAFVLFLSTPALAEPVNINTADAEMLAAALHGVGPAKASAIIAYRDENGPFTSVDQLLEVRGIGPATLASIRDDVLLDDAAPEEPEPEEMP